VICDRGYLLIKEHNCDSEECLRLIDIEHVLYSLHHVVYSPPGNYKSQQEWDKILEKYQFHFIKEYKRANEPTNTYYSLYICSKSEIG